MCDAQDLVRAGQRLQLLANGFRRATADARIDFIKDQRAFPSPLDLLEIDTGIGGRAAEAVGKKLKSLARANQVLCITHLPQIASFADHHYLIEKRETSGRMRTLVRALTAAEQTEEIARMLSGEKLTETSRQHAEQLLKANG